MIQFADTPKIKESDLPDPTQFTSFHPFIKGVFSQWHPTQFEISGQTYTCAEQYMMAAKASLFRNANIAEKIMASSDPELQKRLGAQVRGFDEEQWQQRRCEIVYGASLAKFTQNPGALRQLRNTAPAMLVEANPRDWNWGNGLQIDDPSNHDPTKWKGLNLLGRILTLVREELTT